MGVFGEVSTREAELLIDHVKVSRPVRIATFNTDNSILTQSNSTITDKRIYGDFNEQFNSLRELAENLPRILPDRGTDKAELLQHLANEELAQAEYDEWVKTKVASARADNRPGMTTEQLRKQLENRYQDLRNGV